MSESLPGKDQTKSHLSHPVVRVLSPILTSRRKKLVLVVAPNAFGSQLNVSLKSMAQG